MSSYKRAGFVAAAVAACTFFYVDRLAAAASPEPGAASAELRGFLEAQGSPAFAADDRGAELWNVLQAFYRGRGYQPAWVRGDQLTPGAQALLRVVATTGREGLSPERYDPRAIAGPLDVGITLAFLRYTSDLALGTVDPRGAASLWRVSTRTFDGAALLEEAVLRDAPVGVLDAVRPAHPQYAALVEALARYRRLAAAGGWSMIKPGRSAAQAAALRARLLASGDTLKGFQQRHGLPATGLIDRATLEALNVPVEDRIRQIELNLERWRWQGWDPNGRTILVNVPTFQLHAYEAGREALTMRVITGTGDSQTPVFAEEMNQVVFSPHWNVPANILETEVLPAIRRNPGYLASQNMEMVRAASGAVQVRQRPGPRNALGLVKFLFPNPYNVYLHDTPKGALFARPRRAFSHGCVRLQKPEALARFVLKGAADWSDARIAAAMRGGREQFVALDAPVPLKIVYFTAWVGDGGALRFAPDVYRHDAAQEALFRAPRASTIMASARS